MYLIVMNRTVKRELIDKWIERKAPYGISQLSVKAGCSASLIDKTRLGQVPKKEATRLRIAKAIGVSQDALFPLVTAGEEEQAS